MSSWLSRRFRDREVEEEENKKMAEAEAEAKAQAIAEEEQRKGSVKDDLSELTRSFKKQLWGVANFIAPPPPPSSSSSPWAAVEPSLTRSLSSPEKSKSASARTLSSSTWLSAKEKGAAKETETSSVAGMRSDLAEISTGISKLAANFFQFKADHHHHADVHVPDDLRESQEERREEEDAATAKKEEEEEEEEDVEDEGEEEDAAASAVGITEEVLAFARNISMHPETWIDFPLSSDDDDLDDFEMSEVQEKHALAIECLAPRLAALRIELCPGLMSHGRFWKIYFVLLHSRLNKQDALLLSTPQIVEARALLMQELQKRTRVSTNLETESTHTEGKPAFIAQPPKLSKTSYMSNEKGDSFKVLSMESTTSIAAKDFPYDEQAHAIVSHRPIATDIFREEPYFENKNVLSGTVKLSDVALQDEEVDVDDWLAEEPIGGDTSARSRGRLTNEEDVSFSDLEDEDEISLHKTPTNVKATSESSIKESKEWVQLSSSSSHAEATSGSSSMSYEVPSLNFRTSKGEFDLVKQNESDWQHEKKLDSGDSNDWLTVDKDDIVSTDSS